MANDKTPIKLIKGVYVNREFSWIKFNLRVLEQSVDEDTPVLERGKFLSIFTSNLDEFFMVAASTTRTKCAPKLPTTRPG